MKKIFDFVWAIQPRLLLAVASCFTGLGLAFMVAPIFVKIPLFLVASITVSHACGLVGVVLYGAAVMQEVLQKTAQSRTPLEKDRG